MGHLDFFKNGWIGRRKGDRISFEVECSCIAVQYRKTVRKPSPVAKLVLDGMEEEPVLLDGNFEDGDTEHPVLLDGNFGEDWGDCLYLEKILHHGKQGKHLVEIEVVQAEETDKEPFYLLSLIIS